MKKTFLTTAILFFSLWLFGSCNSTSYELEEVEITSDSIPISYKPSDIKQEIEQPKDEIKNDPNITQKNTISTYTVQIGAFQFEKYAFPFLENAKINLQADIIYIYIDGLFKIRINTVFKNKGDALQLLYKVRDAGYEDSFVIETKF
jgi:hypothetical protein